MTANGDEYRVEFTITRKGPDDEDFTEIGFGSSGTWDSINAASHMVGTALETRDWETEAGQPDPQEVDPSDA